MSSELRLQIPRSLLHIRRELRWPLEVMVSEAFWYDGCCQRWPHKSRMSQQECTKPCAKACSCIMRTSRWQDLRNRLVKAKLQLLQRTASGRTWEEKTIILLGRCYYLPRDTEALNCKRCRACELVDLVIAAETSSSCCE